MIDPESAKPENDSATEPDELEALKVAGVFERELFRIDDARLAATDAQAGILIAAAVALATFTGGLVRNGAVNSTSLVMTGVFAVTATIVAIYARRERPKAFGDLATQMDEARRKAGKCVDEVYVKVAREELGNPAAMALADFNAWHALSESIKKRTRAKRGWYLVSIFVLLLEMAAAISTALSLNPSGSG